MQTPIDPRTTFVTYGTHTCITSRVNPPGLIDEYRFDIRIRFYDYIYKYNYCILYQENTGNPLGHIQYPSGVFLLIIERSLALTPVNNPRFLTTDCLAQAHIKPPWSCSSAPPFPARHTSSRKPQLGSAQCSCTIHQDIARTRLMLEQSSLEQRCVHDRLTTDHVSAYVARQRETYELSRDPTYRVL